MYISINMDTMKVMHKHESFLVVCNLAWIEIRTDTCWIFPADDANALFDIIKTPMEAGMLYLNITGEKASNVGSTLNNILHALIQRIKESDVIVAEVESQASKIKGNDLQKWKYAKGAYTPVIMGDLFDYSELRACASKEEEHLALLGKLAPVQTVKARFPTKPKKGVTGTHTHTKDSANRGTGANIIWSIADKIWNEVGGPTEKREVLKLRKIIMDRLVTEEGLNRSTCSSELGKWHKIRAPF